MLKLMIMERTKALIYRSFFTFLNILSFTTIAFLGGFILIGVYHTTTAFVMRLTPALFFTLVPTATLFFAAGVIFLKDPVHNLLCLIAVFFNAVLFYLYVGAEFLAFLFLIVYVGAIAILFLFVIMLLHLKEVKANRSLIAAGFIIINVPLYVVTTAGTNDFIAEATTTFIMFRDILLSSTDATTIEALLHYIGSRHTDILVFSDLLYTYYVVLFYLAAMLLLTAMLGAIILATSATDSDESRWIATKAPKTSNHYKQRTLLTPQHAEISMIALVVIHSLPCMFGC